MSRENHKELRQEYGFEPKKFYVDKPYKDKINKLKERDNGKKETVKRKESK